MQQGGSYQDFLKSGRGVLFTIILLCGIAALKLQRWCGVNTCLTTVLVENFFFVVEAGTLVEVLSFWSSQDFKVLREYFTN